MEKEVHDEVPEIHHGDADGHGSDSLQQRLPPRQETAVVSMEEEQEGEEEEVRVWMGARKHWRMWGVCFFSVEEAVLK